MKIAYAIQVDESPAIRAWFQRVNDRLRDRKGIVFGGRVRRIREGLYVIGLELYVSPLALVIGPLLCLVAGVAAWLLWQSLNWSNWLTGIGATGLIVTYFLLSPMIHRWLMNLTLWRVEGRFQMLRPATDEMVFQVAHGKI